MKHILVVDDDKLNLVIAYDALKNDYMVSVVTSGNDAIRFLQDMDVDLVLLDIEMTGLNGVETLKILKENSKTKEIPVIFLTSLTDNQLEADCIEMGAQDYITKPFYPPGMLVRVKRTLELDDLRKNLEEMVLDKTKEIESLTIQMITSFANSIDAKDSYTKSHSLHVAQYTEMIAEKLGWNQLEIRNLYYSALLHDIGKIGVPDYVLHKPEKLTSEEFEMIKKHPEIGGAILSEVTVVPLLGAGASFHHEKWDGTGYPYGKKGEEIPIAGRIIGIADAVVAMLSARAYREARSIDYVINELQRCAGKQFDPSLTGVMIEILKEGIDIGKEESGLKQGNSLFEAVLNEYSKANQTDRLTGLCNQSYMETTVNEMLSKPSAKGAMIMLSTDDYHKFTSLFGQLNGKKLLMKIGQTIEKEIGKFDLACRVANDEFLIYLDDIKERDDVEFLVIHLLKALKNMAAELEYTVEINFYMGIVMAPEFGIRFERLYDYCDKSLYLAKRSSKSDYFIYDDQNESLIPEHKGNKVLDIWQMKIAIGEETIGQGAYQVNLYIFSRILKLLQRSSKRSNETISMLAFTLEMPEEMEMLILEESSKVLLEGMKKILRAGDTITRFNNVQFLAILASANVEEAEKVGKRVQNYYETMKELGMLSIVFDVTRIN